MATTNDIYAEMQRYAPLELAESWDNPGLLVDCGREVSRVLVTLDITPEVVEEAAAGGCELIVSHHPVIFSPLKKLTPRDVSFQLVQKGISAICMHTNLDAAEGGVNEILAGIFGMRDWEVFADGCGRVGEVDPITVPERPCGAGQVCRYRQDRKAAGGHQRRGRKHVRGCPCRGGGLSADRRGQPPRGHRCRASGAVAGGGGALRHRVPGVCRHR